MIEGFNIRCTVGGLEVLRSPRIVLALRRRAIVSRCELDVPDTDGSVQAVLAKKQPVRIGSATVARAAHGTTGQVRSATSKWPGRMRCALSPWGGSRRCSIPKSLKPCMESPPMSSPQASCFHGAASGRHRHPSEVLRISSFPG